VQPTNDSEQAVGTSPESTASVEPTPAAEPPTGTAAPSQPLLATLAPALRQLEQRLRLWLGSRRSHQPDAELLAKLAHLADDLRRQADALDVERPLLVVMLMGGTGVGKSTLLNALAGGQIAQASFQRPTTRDPVVYYHESIRTDRLDPALRLCRLVAHNRPELMQKVIVDTPDLDSNDLANRDRLREVLPVADIVLYVGSQEKYHDQLGWELFLEQKQRRAFAFVLNKWDRCQHAGASGLRPDDDWLRDLRQHGFANPLLFRTMAQSWLDQLQAGHREPPADLVEGEEFAKLRDWLELGLTRLEIEAVKAKGVEQLLTQLSQTLTQVAPPDLVEAAQLTRQRWEPMLAAEANDYSQAIVGTIDPYQSEVEHHFSVEGHSRFRGLMARYLKLLAKTRLRTGSLRDRLPSLSASSSSSSAPPTEAKPAWNLSTFTQAAGRAAGLQILDARIRALVNRLLPQADPRIPTALLYDELEKAACLDWHMQYDEATRDTLLQIERIYSNPHGWRKVVQSAVIWTASTLPEIAFAAALLRLLWFYFMVENYQFSWLDLALPFVVLLATLVLMQLLIALVLPIRWSAVRSDFQKHLLEALTKRLHDAFLAVPTDLANQLAAERQTVLQLRDSVEELIAFLRQRQQAAHIGELFSK
jgi:energy-coupling factor transporter ATP-binding protein EcfA2